MFKADKLRRLKELTEPQRLPLRTSRIVAFAPFTSSHMWQQAFNRIQAISKTYTYLIFIYWGGTYNTFFSLTEEVLQHHCRSGIWSPSLLQWQAFCRAGKEANMFAKRRKQQLSSARQIHKQLNEKYTAVNWKTSRALGKQYLMKTIATKSSLV